MIKKKTVDQHLDDLIKFYKETDIQDVDYLLKLIVRNLHDVKNRYLKEVNGYDWIHNK